MTFDTFDEIQKEVRRQIGELGEYMARSDMLVRAVERQHEEGVSVAFVANGREIATVDNNFREGCPGWYISIPDMPGVAVDDPIAALQVLTAIGNATRGVIF